jgi:hypothetical protein
MGFRRDGPRVVRAGGPRRQLSSRSAVDALKSRETSGEQKRHRRSRNCPRWMLKISDGSRCHDASRQLSLNGPRFGSPPRRHPLRLDGRGHHWAGWATRRYGSEIHLVAAAGPEVDDRVICDPTARISSVDGACEGDCEARFGHVAEVWFGQSAAELGSQPREDGVGEVELGLRPQRPPSSTN